MSKMINILTKGFLLGSLFIFLSCSIFDQRPDSFKGFDDYKLHTKDDFVKHYSKLGISFIESNRNNLVKLSPKSYKFLKDIRDRLVENNEIILSRPMEFKLYIVKDKRPYHFSFPSGEIVLSSSIIQNYIKTEAVLSAVLAIELVKQHNRIYKKNLIVPLDYLTYEDILPYLNLNLDTKEELNKWVFYTLRRGGYDPLSLLKFVQIKNKNFLDFLSTSETSDGLSREETLLKSFLIRNKLIDSYQQIEKNSSSAFYSFISEVRQRS